MPEQEDVVQQVEPLLHWDLHSQHSALIASTRLEQDFISPIVHHWQSRLQRSQTQGLLVELNHHQMCLSVNQLVSDDPPHGYRGLTSGAHQTLNHRLKVPKSVHQVNWKLARLHRCNDLKSFSLMLSHPSYHQFSSLFSHTQIIPFLLNPNESPIYSPHAHVHLSILSMSGCISLCFIFSLFGLVWRSVRLRSMICWYHFNLPFRYWQTLCYVCVDSSISLPSHIQQSVFLGCFCLRAFLCHDCNTRWMCNKYILTRRSISELCLYVDIRVIHVS